MKSRLGFALLTMGFSGLVAQMLLLRELLVVFSGNELSIGIVLANWLILEAAGCYGFGKKAESTNYPTEIFVGITILFSLSLPAAVYLTRILKTIIGISIGESIGFVSIFYSSLLILLPISVSHGALFPLCCRIYATYFAPDASSVGKVYVYETIGTIVGGFVWTYLLIPYLDAFQMAVGLATLNFVCLVVLLAPNYKRSGRQKSITALSALFLGISSYMLLAGGTEKLHRLSIKAQWKDHNIVHYQNSIHGNTAVLKSGAQYLFFSDGIPSLITPIPDIEFVEKFVHLPLLAHPEPKAVLVLSGGAGGVIDEILRHPSIAQIDYAELDPLFIDLVRKFPTPLTEKELTHAKVAVKHVDGRLFLRMTPHKYDIVMVGLSNPTDLQTNRFFTQEFFSLANKRLDQDGILVLGLPGSLIYANDELRNLNGCIYNTLKAVFPYVRVFPGDGTNLFLASPSGDIHLMDATWLINKLQGRGIEVNIPVSRHIMKKLHPGWQSWFSDFLEGSTRKINHDFKPLGMFYSVSHWNARFAPYLRGLFRWFEKINLQIFLILTVFFMVAVFLIRYPHTHTVGSGIPFCIATTGFAGMIFDLALIFTFQSIYGYVFAWIGLLVTSFMAGTAAGAMLITSRLARITNGLKLLINTDLALICFSSALPFIFLVLYPYLDSPGAFLFLKVLFLIVAFISGFLIGAQFPLANKIYLQDDKGLSTTAGKLYSADLVGGWLGGVVGGVVLLPVLGLLGSCVVVVLLKLCSLTLLSVRGRQPSELPLVP